MRTLMPVSEDFTHQQLMIRLKIYHFKEWRGLLPCNKQALIEVIEHIESTFLEEDEE